MADNITQIKKELEKPFTVLHNAFVYIMNNETDETVKGRAGVIIARSFIQILQPLKDIEPYATQLKCMVQYTKLAAQLHL